MLIAWLGSDKYQLLSYLFDLTRDFQIHSLSLSLSLKMGDGHSTHSVIRSGAQKEMYCDVRYMCIILNIYISYMRYVLYMHAICDVFTCNVCMIYARCLS